MKNFLRIASILLLIAITVGLTIPLGSSSAATFSVQERRDKHWVVKDSKAKRGREVAARVRGLKAYNNDVRAALKAFENKGRVPGIDDATSISGTFTEVTSKNPKSQDYLQKANSKQQTTVSGNGYELTLVPSVVIDGEWQGTAICTKYDEYGNIADQYTANIVTIADSNGDTQVVYEVRYQNGIPYLLHQPGMYTGFTFGMTIQEHISTYGAPPPVDLETWQFGTTQFEQQYYQAYPEQQQYQTPDEQQQYQELPSRRSPMQDQISRLGDVIYRPAGFQTQLYRDGLFFNLADRDAASFRPAKLQTRSDRSATRDELRRFCGSGNGCGPPITVLITPNVRNFFVWTVSGCAGAAVACRGNPQCSAWGCLGAAVWNLPYLFQ